MSEPVIDAQVEAHADPTTFTAYMWIYKMPDWSEPMVWTVSGPMTDGDPLAAARRQDPRLQDRSRDATAVLVRVQVPLSELRRRRDG